MSKTFIVFCSFLFVSVLTATVHAKVAVVVPGFTSKENTKGFPNVKKALLSKGYEVILADADWKKFNLDSYYASIKKQISKKILENEPITVVSSSLGSVLATRLVKDFNIERYLFVSPVPLYKEHTDSMFFFQWPRLIWHLFKTKKKDSLFEFCDAVNTQQIDVTIFYGKIEWRENKNFARLLHSCLPRSTLVGVPYGMHGIRNRKNNAALRKVIHALP